MAAENLRREPRIDARIKVTVVRGRERIALESSDVSFRGLFVRTDTSFPVRALLRLRVALPVREIEAHAMVVHVSAGSGGPDARGSGVGLQFWGLAGPDRIAWDEFVRERLQAKHAASKGHGVAPQAAGNSPDELPAAAAKK